jgi:hypothetical protein
MQVLPPPPLSITLYMFACTIQHIGAVSKTNTSFRLTSQQLQTRKAFNEIKNRSFSTLKHKTFPSRILYCTSISHSSSTFLYPVFSTLTLSNHILSWSDLVYVALIFIYVLKSDKKVTVKFFVLLMDIFKYKLVKSGVFFQ